ncbi:SDR family oxidoreductase [Paenibacillus mendelii]|uniref:SDR family oxidoreductase n=1 Tax=Paenibacillus mendelii TaxID=206163 RepID=A0ABV6JJ46_9BACL|nr:SDR family oxidoreductase [Paenibacillus mendelii]
MNARPLQDKVVVITGATGGIGRAIAKALAPEGAKLVLGSRRVSVLEALAEELKREDGCEAVYSGLDVTDEEEVRHFFLQAAQNLGRLDILLSLAGLSIPSGIADMTIEQYEQSIDVNLKGTFLCAKHFMRHVDSDRGGFIVNTGSMAAKRANGNAPLYCTAKAAVNMFTQGLALQAVDKNIRVTVLNPGATDTEFWGTRPVARDKFMQASDVAGVILSVLKMPPQIVVHEISFESFGV